MNVGTDKNFNLAIAKKLLIANCEKCDHELLKQIQVADKNMIPTNSGLIRNLASERVFLLLAMGSYTHMCIDLQLRKL